MRLWRGRCQAQAFWCISSFALHLLIVQSQVQPSGLHLHGHNRRPALTSSFGSRFATFALRLRGGRDHHTPEVETENILPELSQLSIQELQREDGAVDLREPAMHRQERFRDKAEQGTDLVGDGGLFKRTVRNGTGPANPVDGDFIYVHYRGFVLSDGREFDDSRRSEQLLGRPFGFTLGKGEVMKGWDVAVRTMRQGEVAELWVSNKYTWSDDGLRLKGLEPYTAINCAKGVPEDADVKFLLELVEFGHGRASTSDGLVRVFVDDPGTVGIWQRRPNRTAGDEVDIRVSVSHRGRRLFSTTDFSSVQLGTGDLPLGLQLCLDRHLGVNGTATVRMWGKWAACLPWEREFLPNGTQHLAAATRNARLDARSQLAVGSGWNQSRAALHERQGRGLFDSAEDYLEARVELREWSTIEYIGDGNEVQVKSCGVQDRVWTEVQDDAEEDGLGSPARVVQAHFSGGVYEDDVGDGDRVHLSVEAWAEGTGATFFNMSELQCELGDGSLPVGVELAVAKVKLRQRGEIKVGPGDYQMDGCGTPLWKLFPGLVGPGDSVRYRVIVKALVEHPYRKPVPQKIAMADDRKEQGNMLLSLNATYAAMAKYKDAFRLIEYEDTDNPEEFVNPESLEMETVHSKLLDDLLALKAALQLNMATVFQRMGLWKEGIEKCTEVLAEQPGLAKAYYKRSVLQLKRDDTTAALKDIMEAKRLSPLSTSIAKQLRHIQDNIEEQETRERKMWGSVLERGSPRDSSNANVGH